MSVAESGGLPYLLMLLDKPCMIKSNIDIDDELVNGVVGTLKYIEWDDDATANELRVKRVWLYLQPNAVGKAARIKARPYVFANPGVVYSGWTLMTRKTATITFKKDSLMQSFTVSRSGTMRNDCTSRKAVSRYARSTSSLQWYVSAADSQERSLWFYLGQVTRH
jgi:hypothetical protein